MNVRLLNFSAAIALTALLSACGTTSIADNGARKSPAASSTAAEIGGNLFRAIEEHVRSQGSTLNDIPHQTAYTDLNNDGKIDVMLMLNAPEWCIGDSCTLMIFEGTETGAKLLAELTLISSPIAIGEAREGGWRDVFVTLPGAAGKSTMAKISHNGDVYPESPSNWSFLSGTDTLPGRPVLVGGGAAGTELANFDQLLAEVDSADVTAAMSVEPLTDLIDDNELSGADVQTAATAVSATTSAGNENFYGRYSWGPGEAYFRPCGGSSVYWVTASERVAGYLDNRYRQIARLQFDDVYLVMKGQSAQPPKEGEASFYDGVLDIEQVISMEAVDEDTCSQVPSS